MTAHYQKVGLRGSTELAAKFPDAQTYGFMYGPRNRLTIVDLDTADPAIIEEGERLFGASPVLWQTGGGKYAMAYRHNGEPRLIRPFGKSGPQIDLLGGGLCVAPPSRGAKQQYQIIRGTLADLDRLPVARTPNEIAQVIAGNRADRIPKGSRQNELFKYCNSIVGYCDTPDQLIDAATTWADDRLASPLPAVEIIKTCNSVWQYRGGRKRIMNQIIDGPHWAELRADPEILGVFTFLAAENGPTAEFMIADGLAAAMGWRRRLIPEARDRFLKLGLIERTRRLGKTGPYLYRWRTELTSFFDIPLAVGNPSITPSPSPQGQEEARAVLLSDGSERAAVSKTERPTQSTSSTPQKRSEPPKSTPQRKRTLR